MDKLLSIIIPSYNMEKYLDKCIGSCIIEDTDLLQCLDIIAVNDGSKDRTSEIGHKWEETLPGVVRVIDKPNGNYGSCVNIGLREARGVYVKILDADDYIETGAFLKLVRLLPELCEQEKSVDMIISDYDCVGPSGEFISKVDYQLGNEGYKTFADKKNPYDRFAIHSICYKNENLRRLNYHQSEGMSYTDTEWIIEPMVTIRRFYYLPHVVSHYLVGRDGQTMEQSTYAKRFQQVVDITVGMLSRFNDLSRMANAVALEYYMQQVVIMADIIYDACVWGCGGNKANADFVAFDKYLSNFPELYKAAGARKLTARFFDFYYVEEWRRNYSLHTIRFFLFAIYVRIGKLVKGMR